MMMMMMISVYAFLILKIIFLLNSIPILVFVKEVANCRFNFRLHSGSFLFPPASLADSRDATQFYVFNNVMFSILTFSAQSCTPCTCKLKHLL
jgi:hypothetical protein